MHKCVIYQGAAAKAHQAGMSWLFCFHAHLPTTNVFRMTTKVRSQHYLAILSQPQVHNTTLTTSYINLIYCIMREHILYMYHSVSGCLLTTRRVAPEDVPSSSSPTMSGKSTKLSLKPQQVLMVACSHAILSM